MKNGIIRAGQSSVVMRAGQSSFNEIGKKLELVQP